MGKRLQVGATRGNASVLPRTVSWVTFATRPRTQSRPEIERPKEAVIGSNEADVIRANTNHARSDEWMNAAYSAIFRQSGKQSVAVSFDPDDYPVY